MFSPSKVSRYTVPCLISCTGVTGRWGLLSHAQNVVRWLALSKRLAEAPPKHRLSCSCPYVCKRNSWLNLRPSAWVENRVGEGHLCRSSIKFAHCAASLQSNPQNHPHNGNCSQDNVGCHFMPKLFVVCQWHHVDMRLRFGPSYSDNTNFSIAY